MRLVDADKLNIYKAWVEIKTDDDAVIYAGKRKIVLADDVADAPTVDAVEVVRCKDCKWWKTNYSWNGNERKICAKEAYEPLRNADDFCSHGERREDV